MESLLTKLGTISDTKSVSGLIDAIHVAKESVKIPAVPSHEKRAKCFTVFRLALSAGKPKLSLIALEGLQLMLRDSTLLTDTSTKKPEDALSVQMLKSLEQLPEWDKQIQCQLLTVIVQLISSNEVTVTLNDVYNALQICTKTFVTEEVSVKLAVRAAITQFLNSFCSNRHAKVIQHTNPSQEEIAVFMDMTALLSEIYRRLSTAESADELQLSLDSVYSILSAQPDSFHKHQPLLNVFSTELAPCLICLLHAAADEKPPPTKSLLSRTPTTPIKFNVFSFPESARSFYQVIEQVVRLLARVPDAEPLALELLRNALLLPNVSRRGEALKLLKRLFSTESRFVEFLDLCAREPQFWPVVLSCLEECSKTASLEGARDSIAVMNALFVGLHGQLNPGQCDRYTPIVHEILRAAATTNGENRMTISSGKVRMLKRRITNDEAEHLAEEFVSRLKSSIGEWQKIDDWQTIDSKVQEFAARIADEFTDLEAEHNQNQSLLSTDAAYLTCWAALSFGLRSEGDERFDRAAFFGQVTGSGCIVYANENWLNAVYDGIVSGNLFAEIDCTEETVLMQMIEDYDGHNKRLLSTARDDDAKERENKRTVVDDRYLNFQSWIRNQLASSWSTVLSILTKFSLKLDKKCSTEKLQTDGVEATFEATASLLKLLLKLRLGSEITWIFERIGEEICLLEDLREFVVKSVGIETRKPWRINRIDALCIDLVLENCVECGTLSSSCWKYTVRTVEYVVELERYLFRLTKTANTVYDASEVSLNDLLGKISQNDLSLATVGRVLDELMLKIDGLFEDAPKVLNLPALCKFIGSMCTADEDHLRTIENASSSVILEIYVPSSELSRISRVVVSGAQKRPLAHLMRIWGAVKDHLIETSGSKFPPEIARLAITVLYECMRALMTIEPPRSSFHQSLLTSYQNVLCTDVCNEETQEHIVSNLSNFIQDIPHQLGSGWKPLFGALKAIRISPISKKQGTVLKSYSKLIDLADISGIVDEIPTQSTLTPANYAVISVFRRYIAIADPTVLVPTALEFVHCVVHYLQSTDGFEKLLLDSDSMPTSETNRDTEIGSTVFSLILELQRLLERFFVTSATSSTFPTSVAILNRLKNREKSAVVVDESIVDAKLSDVSDLAGDLLEDENFAVQPKKLNERISCPYDSYPWVEWTDGQKCVVELMLSLMDELVGLILTCSRSILSKLLVGIADLVGGLKTGKIGLSFGSYAICSVIIPLLQKWARREHSGFLPSSQIPQSSRSLKQATTIFTELAADYVRYDPLNAWNEKLVVDLLILYCDFLSHSSPFVAGTGSACLRHLILSVGSEFTESLWSIVVRALWKASCLSVLPVRKLVSKFVPNSVDVNGDIGEVHVVVRQDSQNVDYAELRAMAHQIFQIEARDSAEKSSGAMKRIASVDSDGDPTQKPQFAYIFVFQPKTTQQQTHSTTAEKAVSIDELIAGLMSAQALLQLFAQLLLGAPSTNSFSDGGFSRSFSLPNTQPLRHKLSRVQLGTLIVCLDAIDGVASEFDSRPSLKYLIQKLINGDQPANLYRLTVASQSTKLQTIFELAKQIGPTKDDVLKVTKKQGAANANLNFIRLIDSLVERSFDTLERLDGQVANNGTGARDRMDLDFEPTGSVETPPPSTPPVRANPFVSRLNVKATRPSTDSTDGLQMAQLSDLDLRLIAQSEVVAILVQRVLNEETEVFRVFLPLFLPKIRRLMRISPAKRSRLVCAEFLERLDKEWEITS
ncbi:DUF1981 domain-containing protein [Aphelenchoides besseyi]|nr:DUF1981 domain-containing protein [Aphelenchoides besseyi]